MTTIIETDLGTARIIKDGSQICSQDRVALLASHSEDGSIKAYVEYYASRLSMCGFRVILIIASDRTPAEGTDLSYDTTADYVILRDNAGFDFGSWSHAFQVLPGLFDAKSCLLTNDSLFGPFSSFSKVIDKIFALESQADMVSLTDNNEVAYHLQSYFLHISGKMLTSRSFRLFMGSIRPFDLKTQVISLYEIPFTRFAGMSGFKFGALFSVSSLDITENSNLTTIYWRELIQKGFPFIKIQLLRDNPDNADLSDWEDTLKKAGYNTDLVHEYLKNP